MNPELHVYWITIANSKSDLERKYSLIFPVSMYILKRDISITHSIDDLKNLEISTKNPQPRTVRRLG